MKCIWKQFFAALLSVALAFALLPATARAEGGFGGAESGDGSSGTPYLISTKEQLEAFREYISSDDGHGEGQYFTLTDDIDLGGGEGTQWTPIGTNNLQFQGTFDGDNHTISGLNITSGDNRGLFGVIGNSGTVKNLTVKGSVTGSMYVGGIAGHSFGNIENCHNAANIKGSSYTGGIVGFMESAASVQNCSNTGTVNAGSSRGGIAGNVTGTIRNCYNAGEVTGTSSNAGGIAGFLAGTIENCYNVGEITGGSIAGGIVGNNRSGSVEYCYNYGVVSATTGGPVRGNGSGSCSNCYYLNTTWDKDGRGAESKSAEQFASGEVAYLLQQDQDSQVWGQTVGSDYPELTDNIDKAVYKITGKVEGQNDVVWYSNSTATLPEAPVKAGFTFAGWSTEQGGSVNFDKDSPVSADMTVYAVWKVPFEGSGTDVDPYIIPDLATLELFRDYINAGNGKGEFFKLTADIDMSDEYGEEKSWTPIGDSYAQVSAAGQTFRGTFDGNGHKITGLYINKPNKEGGEYQGLFGKVGFYDTLTTNPGTIKNLTVSGTVTGYEDVGGIAGIVYKGTIENCVSNVIVTATNRSAGGIAGSNQDTVKACVNTGAVSAVQYAGGLVGTSDGTVINCYNTANISCTGDSAGGIAGFCAESGVSDGTTLTGAIKNCYSVGKISGPKEIGGITGACKNTCDINNCYWVFYPNTNTATSGAGQGSFTSAQIASEREGAGFANGKVAWLLSQGDNAVNWGQKIGSDEYPVFDGEKVYRVAFTTGHRTLERNPYDTRYTNSGGTVTLPKPPEGWLATDYEYLKFDYWSTTNAIDGPEFTDKTTVTADTVVYAVGRQTFGGGIDAPLSIHEGYSNTFSVDLDIFMAYQSGNPAAGKFDYEIASDANGTKASLSGSTLTVPAGLEPGTYEITVTAKEKAPDYALMSVESYGVEPVTLTVQVVIGPHIWSLKSTDEATGSRTYTCGVCNKETVVESGKYFVSGEVTESDGKNPSVGAGVTLKRGGETVAQSATDSNGRYYFPGVEPGIYNLVVGEGDNTTTVLVEVTGDTPLDNITELPENVSSKLEVKGENPPAVVVGGLDKEAQASADLDPDSDTTVTVTMTVEAVTDGAADNAPALQDSIDAIKSESESSGHDYLDLTIEKTVSDAGGAPTTEPLTETKEPLTVILSFDFTGKSNIVVYRYHGAAVDTLTEDENTAGEYIELDPEDGMITLHVKNFSIYAIGYTVQTAPTSYAVTVPQAEHGTVTADRRSATRGRAVTLTATPDEGCHLASLTVTDRSGKPVELTDNGDGTYTFTQPSGRVTVAAQFVPCPTLGYADLDAGAWYHDCTDYVITNALMRGVADGIFDPDGAVTRAQMVTVLWNMSGDPVVNYYMTCADVTEADWYAEAVRWAASEGIAGGYGDGFFGPDDPINREQMAVMIYRYEQKYGSGGFTGDWMFRLPFVDLVDISDWAFEAVAWCNMKGVITGKDNAVFDPKGPAKRAELAAILTRYCGEDDIK